MRKLFLALIAALLVSGAPLHAEDRVAERVTKLTRATKWMPVAALKLGFRTHHPQGMVKIGANFYLSSVEVRTRPKKLPAPVDGYDRDTGTGVGHLFKIGPDGRLIADLILGEGSIYHPGGVDFDGISIWVPVAEYRPGSRSIVYRVDPEAMTATEAFRFADHLGSVVRDREGGTFHGVSWGSRSFYSWPMRDDGSIDAPVAPRRTANPAHYIDYQDCHFAGEHRMLCGGLGEYATGPGQPRFRIGGFELIDLTAGRPLWQVPVELWAPSGLPMTQNPFFVEATAAGLRAWFVPDDEDSTLFTFDAAIP